jgi:hypothetical protein
LPAGRQSASQEDLETTSVLGLLCSLLAALDLVTSRVGLPLTSVGWSPVVFMLLGGWLFTPETRQGRDRPGT